MGLIWGSSFLWIKLAVADISPLLLVALRFAFGLAALLAYAAWRRERSVLGAGRGLLGRYLFMGIVNTALPIALVSWSETHIASGLAAILNATVPLFAILVAHVWLHDERISAPRLLGLGLGFLGVVVVVLPDLLAEGLHADLLGQLAVLAAAACYALGGAFARRHLRGQSALRQSVMVLAMADLVSWAAVLARPAAGGPALAWPTQATTWLAALWLGVLGSGLAYLLYFHLIRAWGVTRTSLVTYVLPVFGLALGALFLGEAVGPNMVVGLVLILAGIGLVNRAAA